MDNSIDPSYLKSILEKIIFFFNKTNNYFLNIIINYKQEITINYEKIKEYNIIIMNNNIYNDILIKEIKQNKENINLIYSKIKKNYDIKINDIYKHISNTIYLKKNFNKYFDINNNYSIVNNNIKKKKEDYLKYYLIKKKDIFIFKKKIDEITIKNENIEYTIKNMNNTINSIKNSIYKILNLRNESYLKKFKLFCDIQKLHFYTSELKGNIKTNINISNYNINLKKDIFILKNKINILKLNINIISSNIKKLINDINIILNKKNKEKCLFCGNYISNYQKKKILFIKKNNISQMNLSYIKIINKYNNLLFLLKITEDLFKLKDKEKIYKNKIENINQNIKLYNKDLKSKSVQYESINLKIDQLKSQININNYIKSIIIKKIKGINIEYKEKINNTMIFIDSKYDEYQYIKRNINIKINNINNINQLKKESIKKNISNNNNYLYKINTLKKEIISIKKKIDIINYLYKECIFFLKKTNSVYYFINSYMILLKNNTQYKNHLKDIIENNILFQIYQKNILLNVKNNLLKKYYIKKKKRIY